MCGCVWVVYALLSCIIPTRGNVRLWLSRWAVPLPTLAVVVDNDTRTHAHKQVTHPSLFALPPPTVAALATAPVSTSASASSPPVRVTVAVSSSILKLMRRNSIMRSICALYVCARTLYKCVCVATNTGYGAPGDRSRVCVLLHVYLLQLSRAMGRREGGPPLLRRAPSCVARSLPIQCSGSVPELRRLIQLSELHFVRVSSPNHRIVDQVYAHVFTSTAVLADSPASGLVVAP